MEFPGGHGPFLSHPEAFAQTLRKASKTIADATSSEAIVQLGVDSRQQVDALVDRALAGLP